MQTSKKSASIKQLSCNRCGKTCSSWVPEDTLLRGWLECPECVGKSDETDIDLLRKELRAAQAQVAQILKAKAALEHEVSRCKHDIGGMVGYLNSQRHILEMIGVPLSSRGPNLKTEATILMNAAINAAEGKTYTPCSELAAVRKRASTAEAANLKNFGKVSGDLRGYFVMLYLGHTHLVHIHEPVDLSDHARSDQRRQVKFIGEVRVPYSVKELTDGGAMFFAVDESIHEELKRQGL